MMGVMVSERGGTLHATDDRYASAALRLLFPNRHLSRKDRRLAGGVNDWG